MLRESLQGHTIQGWITGDNLGTTERSRVRIPRLDQLGDKGAESGADLLLSCLILECCLRTTPEVPVRLTAPQNSFVRYHYYLRRLISQ
jgi:hypothetical protein